MDCKVKDGTSDTLQFKFLTLTPAAAENAKIEFGFNNFQNPYSGVLVETDVRWYSDADCKVDQAQQEGTALTFSTAIMA
jgi:hypothetical protein